MTDISDVPRGPSAAANGLGNTDTSCRPLRPLAVAPSASPLSRSRFAKAFQRFFVEKHGSISVETVLIAPLLIWGMVATYVFYDGFRHKSRVQIAANTVVDVLSRQTEIITPQFVEDLNVIFDSLATARGTTSMRVSSVAQLETGQPPVIAWSYGTRGVTSVSELQELTGAVPPILTGEAAIVLETFGTWVPPFPLLGMENLVALNTQVTSRPRFVPWLHLQGAIPVFDNFNPENSDPNHGYDRTGVDPYTPSSPGTGGGSTGAGSGGSGGTGTGSTTTAPNTADPNTGTNTGTTSGGSTGGGGTTTGNANRPLRQIGLWDFDDPFNALHDRAVISNTAQVWGSPQFRANDRGAYTNDGGFWLNNCVAGNSIQRANSGAQNYIHIPWHQDYDLTSATLRMVFTVDALPPTTNYTYNSSGNRLLSMDHGLGPTQSPAWALFSRDALGQSENGHFTSWVMGDGAIIVRYQLANANWGNWQGYAGTNYFLSAPAGTVVPGQNVDMQLTFDHDLNKLDLYINGDLADSHPHVPVTLAGNREPWVLGAGNTHSRMGSHRDPNPGMYLCGTIHHFEIWQGAYSAREVELMACGIEAGSDEWFQYFYANMGRYPLPGEGLPPSANAQLCGTSGTQSPPPAPPPPPPPAQCTAHALANQNFEDAATLNWSIPRTAHSNAFTRFLGRFAGGETVTWSRTLPADTTRLLVDFDLYVIDSWDGIGHGWSGQLGDRLDMLVNGQLVGFKHFRQDDAAYRNATTLTASVGGASYVINLTPVQHGSNLGFGGYSDQRWTVSMTVTNPPSTFNLGLMARLDENVDNESWGLDNFHVRTSCDSTPTAPTPTHLVTTNIPYWWGDTYENWFTRPASIPAGEWNQQAFSISGGGGIQARDWKAVWVNSGTMSWDGVQLKLTTPAHGTTTTALLEIGPHLIQYNFVRASNP